MSLQVSMDKNQMTPSAWCGCSCDHLALLGLWGWCELQAGAWMNLPPYRYSMDLGEELFLTELSLALFVQGHSNSVEVGPKPSAP